MTKQRFIETLVDGWASKIVARSKVGEFSGGAICGRTVANAESQGDRVPGRMRIGRQIVYPAGELAAWIAEKYFKEG